MTWDAVTSGVCYLVESKLFNSELVEQTKLIKLVQQVLKSTS